jgi:NitT/TauT family transport system ATP-binding protein
MPLDLQVESLSHSFNSPQGSLLVLDDASLSLERNEFVCLIGPSGSGKTTLMRILAGLLKPTSGKLGYPEGQKSFRIGLVFQQTSLMPWRNVVDNITLPLILQGRDETSAKKEAGEWIRMIGLAGFETTWPRELSGGMAQRVALARALIQDPDLLLMDEPFGSLDALTRERMGSELLQLWQERQKTVLMVTHSIDEALLLSDRVLVFTPRPGRIKKNLTVSLPRPRQDELRYTPEFSALARQLRSAITI